MTLLNVTTNAFAIAVAYIPEEDRVIIRDSSFINIEPAIIQVLNSHIVFENCRFVVTSGNYGLLTNESNIKLLNTTAIGQDG
jgi:hypothetical protein